MLDLDKEKRDARIYEQYWKMARAKDVGQMFGLTAVEVYRIWKGKRALDPNLPKQLCKCGKPRAGASHYCSDCLRCFRRDKRKNLTEEQRRKENARAYTHLLIRRGKLRRQPCGVCSIYPSEAHHPDHSKPAEILWLCRDHHVEVHRRAAESAK